MNPEGLKPASIRGLSTLLNDSTVEVPNASLKSGGGWKETGAGTGVFTTNTSSTVNDDGWSEQQASDKYDIKRGGV
ncbi:MULTISPECIES: hypothetical protein [Rahnella]|uniref:hypothetical protein n=1 Tax=Rahnella TaxID=34037 RepID=UPI003F6E3B97